MSSSPIVTRGFGSFAGKRYVPTRGYGISNTPPPPAGGGVMAIGNGIDAGLFKAIGMGVG